MFYSTLLQGYVLDAQTSYLLEMSEDRLLVKTVSLFNSFNNAKDIQMYSMLEVIRPFPEAEQVVMRHSHKFNWKTDTKPFFSSQIESNLVNLYDSLTSKLYQDHFPQAAKSFYQMPDTFRN